jgi:hypothetical protein
MERIDFLFILPEIAVRQARRLRLAAYKKAHGIKTHSFRDADPNARWLAVKVPAKRLDNGGPIEGMHLEDMMIHFCRLLEDAGLTGYGPTERDAIEAVAKNSSLPPFQ